MENKTQNTDVASHNRQANVSASSRLDEMREQLRGCKFESTGEEYHGKKIIEWWYKEEDKQVIIISDELGRFNLFRFIGNEFTTVKNLQEIAIIAYEEKLP